MSKLAMIRKKFKESLCMILGNLARSDVTQLIGRPRSTNRVSEM